jgi:hypothetical protein
VWLIFYIPIDISVRHWSSSQKSDHVVAEAHHKAHIYMKSWNAIKAIKREKMEVGRDGIGKKNGSEEGNWGTMGRLKKRD